MQLLAQKTARFKEGQSLADFIVKELPSLKEGSILVVTSKIVSLAEGRTVPLSEKQISIRKEGQRSVSTKKVVLAIKDGMIMANAGVDESNADGKIILLPKDAYKSAEILRRTLMKKYKLKRLGIIISDSALMPLRRGVVAAAIGYAGFRGLRDYLGTKDLFGRKMTMTQTNIADALASSAIVLMGEGNEQKPLAVIIGVPVVFTNKTQKGMLRMPEKEDMFYPLLKHLR